MSLALDKERNVHPSNLMSSPWCFWIASSTAINLASGYAFLNSPNQDACHQHNVARAVNFLVT